jgi:hypothetical protein
MQPEDHEPRIIPERRIASQAEKSGSADCVDAWEPKINDRSIRLIFARENSNCPGAKRERFRNGIAATDFFCGQAKDQPTISKVAIRDLIDGFFFVFNFDHGGTVESEFLSSEQVERRNEIDLATTLCRSALFWRATYQAVSILVGLVPKRQCEKWRDRAPPIQKKSELAKNRTNPCRF